MAYNFKHLNSIYSGLWEDVKNPSGTTWLEIRDGLFIRKHQGKTYIEKFDVKGKDSNILTYADGEKIVQDLLSANDQLIFRSIYSKEGDMMVYTGVAPGVPVHRGTRYVHKRIGEPNRSKISTPSNGTSSDWCGAFPHYTIRSGIFTVSSSKGHNCNDVL